MRLVDVNNSVTNVVPTGTATADLPVDRRYHAIHLLIEHNGAAATRAQIEQFFPSLKLYIDGITQWDLRTSELLAIYERHGNVFTSGVLTLYFSEPWRRSPAGEDAMAFDARSSRTFQIELQTAGAINPKISTYVEYDYFNGQNGLPHSGSIRKFIRHQIPVAAIGPYTHTNLPDGGSIHGLHCFETNVNDIAAVEVKRNNLVVFNAPRILADKMVKDQGGVPVPGVFHITPDRTERVGHKLDLAARLADGSIQRSNNAIEFDMAAAAAFPLVYEMSGPPNA